MRLTNFWCQQHIHQYFCQIFSMYQYFPHQKFSLYSSYSSYQFVIIGSTENAATKPDSPVKKKGEENCMFVMDVY